MIAIYWLLRWLMRPFAFIGMCWKAEVRQQESLFGNRFQHLRAIQAAKDEWLDGPLQDHANEISYVVYKSCEYPDGEHVVMRLAEDPHAKYLFKSLVSEASK